MTANEFDIVRIRYLQTVMAVAIDGRNEFPVAGAGLIVAVAVVAIAATAWLTLTISTLQAERTVRYQAIAS